MFSLTIVMMLQQSVVLLPPPETFGVETEELLTISATLSGAVLTATKTPPLFAAAIDEACLASPACVSQRLGESGAEQCLMIGIIRSGDALDVRERLYGRDGQLRLEERRVSTSADFAAAPLSTALVAAFSTDPTTATSTTTTTTAATTTASAADPTAVMSAPTAPATKMADVPMIGAVAGGLVAGAGLLVFAVAANTVSDPGASGDAKEAAYVFGWSALAAAAIAGGAAATFLIVGQP